jgi:hypothetical protein
VADVHAQLDTGPYVYHATDCRDRDAVCYGYAYPAANLYALTRLRDAHLDLHVHGDTVPHTNIHIDISADGDVCTDSDAIS